MRNLLLALAMISSSTIAYADKPAPPPELKKKEAPPAPAEAFPIPKDAAAPGDAPGGGGKIKTYEVARPKDAVLTELRDALKKGGWTIAKDEASPRGAVRLEVTKGGKTWKASVVGDAAKTVIVLTLP